MTETLITWLHAPAHVHGINRDVIDLALAHEPTVIDWSEAYWNTDDIEKHAIGYQNFIGKTQRIDSRKRPVGRDVVVSVTDLADIKHEESFFVSKALLSNIKYMPERWGKAVVFDYEGYRVLIVAWHPQPKPLKRKALVYVSYRRGMRRVEKIQRRLEETWEPDLVLNGGDLQQRPSRDWISPDRFAKRLGMRFRRHGIDWQLWKGQGWRALNHFNIDPKTANKKMDHPWSVLELLKETKR